MARTQKLAAGALIVVTLTMGSGSVAFAASGTPSGSTSTTTTSGTTKPAHTGALRIMTAREIWRVVRLHQKVSCRATTGHLKRIAAADAAAARRLARWESFESNAARRTVTQKKAKDVWRHGVDLTKRAPKVIKAFQKLESDAAALTAQIESTCKVAAPST